MERHFGVDVPGRGARQERFLRTVGNAEKAQATGRRGGTGVFAVHRGIGAALAAGQKTFFTHTQKAVYVPGWTAAGANLSQGADDDVGRSL